jgi:protein-S-isoprenylcysteine O-methyltransferase Ste14
MKRLLLWLDVAVGAAMWVFAALYARRPAAWWTGLALGAAGFAGWVTARVQLGSAFTVRAQAHTLVRSGLYARLRHPIYLFGGLAYFGALLALQKWWLLAGWLVLFVVVETVRIRQEEAVLQARFGDEYADYRRQTWM